MGRAPFWRLFRYQNGGYRFEKHSSLVFLAARGLLFCLLKRETRKETSWCALENAFSAGRVMFNGDISAMPKRNTPIPVLVCWMFKAMCLNRVVCFVHGTAFQEETSAFNTGMCNRVLMGKLKSPLPLDYPFSIS